MMLIHKLTSRVLGKSILAAALLGLTLSPAVAFGRTISSSGDSALFGAEQFWHGVLDHDGRPRRRYWET